MMWFFIAAIATVLTAVSLFPQLLKAFKEKKLTNISLPTFLIISTNSFLWMLYGYHNSNYALVIANVFVFSFAVTISFLKIKKS